MFNPTTVVYSCELYNGFSKTVVYSYILRYKQQFYLRTVVYTSVLTLKQSAPLTLFISILDISSFKWFPFPLHCIVAFFLFLYKFFLHTHSFFSHCLLFIPFSLLIVLIAFRLGAFVLSLPPPFCLCSLIVVVVALQHRHCYNMLLFFKKKLFVFLLFINLYILVFMLICIIINF